MNRLSKEFLKERILGKNNNPPALDFDHTMGVAAVLVPFFIKDGEWHVLFIRRTEKDNDPHSGQVAFPGGHAETRDSSYAETALREFEEETGISREKIELIGQLPSSISVTNLKIIPFVGILETPFEVHPQVEEVARVFSMPFDFLNDDKALYEKNFVLPSGEPRSALFYRKFDNEILWGLSARIMNNLIALLR
jgi:8-oxo-dGTP pyrophosphatase MutT (NUDIX family)